VVARLSTVGVGEAKTVTAKVIGMMRRVSIILRVGRLDKGGFVFRHGGQVGCFFEEKDPSYTPFHLQQSLTDIEQTT
jgi:hypothetical protein